MSEEEAPVEFFLDGRAVRCPSGLTVTAALLWLSLVAARTTLVRGEPRALFCGMGVCFDCLMRIDEGPAVRACVTPVRPGMRVSTLVGAADLHGLDAAR